MITVRWLNADPLGDLQKANLATRRLHPVRPMTMEQWRKALRAGHSTLRFLSLEIFDDDCPYTVASHMVRGSKEHQQWEMSTARPDITGKDRDYTSSRWLIGKLTPKALIEVAHDRLCIGPKGIGAEEATREWLLRVMDAMCQRNGDILDLAFIVLADEMKPTCLSYMAYCRHGLDCWGLIK